MKTAVLGEGQDRHIVCNAKLVALAQHYGADCSISDRLLHPNASAEYKVAGRPVQRI